MTEAKLSLPEIAKLVVLMAEAREISNPDLKALYGLTLDGKERIRLNDLKLVESWKKGRAFAHVLTDAGWARVAEEFHAGIDAPTGSPGAMVRALTMGLQRFIERTDHRLADVFTPADDPAASSAPSDAPSASSSAVSSQVSPDSASGYPSAVSSEVLSGASSGASSGGPSAVPDVEARIRAAYVELAREPGAWVSLTRLRPLLGDAARTEVDEELRRMNRMPDVNIVPESNQKALSQQDRDAAVTIGDQDKHLLSIGA